jgi:hypothetical protein
VGAGPNVRVNTASDRNAISVDNFQSATPSAYLVGERRRGVRPFEKHRVGRNGRGILFWLTTSDWQLVRSSCLTGGWRTSVRIGRITGRSENFDGTFQPTIAPGRKLADWSEYDR